MTYYLTTTVLAAILAILMALTIKPGSGGASFVSDAEGGGESLKRNFHIEFVVRQSVSQY